MICASRALAPQDFLTPIDAAQAHGHHTAPAGAILRPAVGTIREGTQRGCFGQGAALIGGHHRHLPCSSPSTLDAFELIAAVDFKENLIMITAQEDSMVHHVMDVHLQPGTYTQSRRNSSLETSASWRFNLR